MPTLFCLLALVVAQSSANRNLLTISVFTLVFAWCLLRLKTEPSVWYQMLIPLSEPLNASKSIAENMILKRVWGHDTSLLNSICDGKGYGAFSIDLHPCMHAIMKLSDNDDEFFGAAVFCYDSPKAISAAHVKCLGQFHISWVEVSVLSLTLLLQQTLCKQSHIPYGSRINSLVRVHVRDSCQGDSGLARTLPEIESKEIPVIIAYLSVPFPFVNMDDGGILEVL